MYVSQHTSDGRADQGGLELIQLHGTEEENYVVYSVEKKEISFLFAVSSSVIEEVTASCEKIAQSSTENFMVIRYLSNKIN